MRRKSTDSRVAARKLGASLSRNTVKKTTTVNFGVLPRAFRDAILADEAASTQWASVRDVVFVWTHQLRSQGCYPERVLVAIKTAVRYAASELVSEKAVEDLVSSAAQSCIERYFDVVEDVNLEQTWTLESSVRAETPQPAA